MRPHRIRAEDTGDASGATVANTGVINGNIELAADPIPRSGYVWQVRRIAPEELVGRAVELQELTDFCLSAGSPDYLWWRAPAWAGKSALMSWFALHPPPGLRIIPFFITARFAGSSDRVAFSSALILQLSELLEQPIPAYLTEATRDGYLLALLDDAALHCARQGERLVLLVDGLDEDRGVCAGDDAYSIAALLPSRPQHGMRVIVAGRPNPPIPSDVPDRHPLRDPAIVRRLPPSKFAEDLRRRAEEELKRILRGTPAERDCLGLLTAAVGGLSGRDLAELTGSEPWRVEEHLHSVAGRTFTSRSSGWNTGNRPDVYLLGHEELQQAAVEFIGDEKLASYRERLHPWADRYQTRGWPEDTPEFLLSGYTRLLEATGDAERMVRHATDSRRHARMLDLSGGDTAALEEIDRAKDLLLRLAAADSSRTDDVSAIGSLAVERQRLMDRNAKLPPELPVVWATLGNAQRALALARSIYDAEDRIAAMTGIAATVAGHEGVDIVAEAEPLVRSLPGPEQQARGLVALARALAGLRDIDHARLRLEEAQLATASIAVPDARATARIAVAESWVLLDDLARAQALVASAVPSEMHKGAVVRIALALVRSGDTEGALRVLESLPGARPRLSAAEDEVPILTGLAEVFLLSGRTAAAQALLKQARIRAGARADLITMVGGLLVRADQAWIAEDLIYDIAGMDYQTVALAHLARAMAEAGQVDDALRLTRRNSAIAHSIRDSLLRAHALTALAQGMTTLGEHRAAADLADAAESAARYIFDPGRDNQIRLALVDALVALGHLDSAQALAMVIPQAAERERALSVVACSMAKAGHHTAAEEIAATIRDDSPRDATFRTVSETLIAAGETAEAVRLAGLITDAAARESVLAEIAAQAVRLGDWDRAVTLIKEIRHSGRHDEALVMVARAASVQGEKDVAKEVVQNISQAALRVAALRHLVADMAPPALAETARWFERTSKRMSSPAARIISSAAAAEVWAMAGDDSAARRLLNDASAAYARRPARSWESDVTTALGLAHVALGDHPAAVDLIKSARGSFNYAEVAATVAAALVRKGALKDAEQVAEAAGAVRSTVLAEVARTLASTGQQGTAVRLARAVESMNGVHTPVADLPSRIEVAELLADIGEETRCLQVVQGIEDAVSRTTVAARIARQQVQDGQRSLCLRLGDIAERTAREITDPVQRSDVAEVVVRLCLLTRRLERADEMISLIDDAERQVDLFAALSVALQPNGRAAMPLMRALSIGGWMRPLPAVFRHDPSAGAAICHSVVESLAIAIPEPLRRRLAADFSTTEPAR